MTRSTTTINVFHIVLLISSFYFFQMQLVVKQWYNETHSMLSGLYTMYRNFRSCLQMPSDVRRDLRSPICPLYQQTDGIVWDIPDIPLNPLSISLNLYHLSHPAVQTDRQDCMGHLRISHSVNLNSYCPLYLIVLTNKWDIPDSTLPHVYLRISIVIPIPPHRTNRQMRLHGTSHSVPCLPFNCPYHPTVLQDMWDCIRHHTLSHIHSSQVIHLQRV